MFLKYKKLGFGHNGKKVIMDEPGFEPGTSRLSGGCTEPDCATHPLIIDNLELGTNLKVFAP